MGVTQLDPITVYPDEAQATPPVQDLPMGVTDDDTRVSIPMPGQQPTPLTPELAQQRAVKTEQGLFPTLGKTADELKPDFVAGKEDLIRREAASKLDAQRDQKKQDMLRDLATKKQGPLTSEEVMNVLDPFNQRTPNADPASVIEKAYATNYVSSLNTAAGYMSDQNVVTKAQAEIPKQAEETLDLGSDLTAKNQYILKKIQDMENLKNSQSWFGWGLDRMKEFSQLYPEIKQRGYVSGKFGELGIGSNIEEQGTFLYRKPFEQFKQNVDEIADKLGNDNPGLAMSFLTKLHGMDVFEKVLDNTFTAMAIPDLALGAKLLKKVLTYNEIRKATNDIVRAAAQDPSASPIRRAEGAGDTAESTVLRITRGVMEAVEGHPDPFTAAKETLLSEAQKIKEDFTANPGTYLSREQYTRILDGLEKDLPELLNKIQTMYRVDRTPQALTEDVVRAYKDKLAKDFKGPSAMLLDRDGPYIETVSNTKWFRERYGDYDGTMLPDFDTALGRAHANDMGGATIRGKAPDTVYIPQAAMVKTERTDRFKTAKGSVYDLHADGTTTRNKAPRPEHPGDEGVQQRSSKTVYITEKDFKGLKQRSIDGLKVSAEPEIGMVPVETWESGPLKGKIHFGNKITEFVAGEDAKGFKQFKLQHGENGVKFFGEDGVEVALSSKPLPGHIPYNIKTKKFGEPFKGDTTIEQQGLGFYIERWVPMDETSPIIRDRMIRDAKGNLIPEATSRATMDTGSKNIINSVLGWVRNSDETLAIQESAQRKAATYAVSRIQKWIKAMNSDIEAIKNKGSWWKPTAYYGKVPGKKVAEQFESTLDFARKAPNPDPTITKPGYFFKTAAELEDHYLTFFQRKPSYQETSAYFNYVKLVEADRMFGEIAEFRNRARVGAETHKISFLGPDGKPIYSDLFDGVTLARLPGNDDTIMMVGTDHKDVQVASIARLGKKGKETLNNEIEQGRGKLIEVYDYTHQPLSNLHDKANNQLIRYVFARNVETKPMSFNHVNRREGGHFEWDYEHYIKQGDIRFQRSGKLAYVGDITIMPVGNRQLGADITKIWNEARVLIRDGKFEEARPLIAKLGVKNSEFTGWYKAGRDDLGKPTSPKLDVNEPVHLVQKGKKIIDMDNTITLRKGFKDESKTGFANNFKVAYNTERKTDFDFRTINDVGTKDNPIYAHQPAKLVDPIPTMNRALNRAVNSSFMDDYKLYAIEHWLREAEKHLDATPEQIRAAPFAWYHKPEFRAGTPANIKWNLISNKYKIDSFVGIPSKFDTWVHTFTEHLADVNYSKFGPEAGRTATEKAISLTPIWLLHHLTNPVDFIRAATFNAKLGLFNPAQFLVQAQTHALIWSLEPRHGTVGTFGTLLHTWSKYNRNPAVLDALDRYYTKVNMFGSKARPGEFKEAMTELERSGFENVAGEHSNISKSSGSPTTNFVEGDMAKGLKMGQAPFRLGEQSTRVTAWYTAFRKFREENPNIPLTSVERNKILNHADMLTVNMSRASSSMLNHGIFSLSTQFLTYQIKLAELFWSKRLGETTTDRMMARARMVTGFSLLYGMPNAIGVTGLPASDWARAHLYDDLGYIPGEKWTTTMLHEGFPAWSLAMITGKLDLQAGNLENVGNRFGSQGWSNINQALRSDIPWIQAIGGAGVATTGKFVSGLFDPFYQGLRSWAQGDTGEDRFTIRSADLVEPWKEISTVNAGVTAWSAFRTGQWIQKNEGFVTDVSPLRAAYLATLGMHPQAQDDAFINNSILKGEKEAFKVAEKEAIKDWRRGLEAFSNKDPEQGNAYIRNAMARLEVVGYPPEEKLKFMAIANKGYESIIDSSNYSYWARGDFNKRSERLEQYQRKLDIEEKRKAN